MHFRAIFAFGPLRSSSIATRSRPGVAWPRPAAWTSLDWAWTAFLGKRRLSGFTAGIEFSQALANA